MSAAAIEVGATVKTLEGDIEGNRHAGSVGVVNGFARFSSHHPREVYVKFPDGNTAWFWLSRVVPT